MPFHIFTVVDARFFISSRLLLFAAVSGVVGATPVGNSAHGLGAPL